MINKLSFAKEFKDLKHKSKDEAKPVGPKGLPESRTNDDNYTGTYEGENLSQFGFNHNGVVGTGDGPIIGISPHLG